jgi:predicted Rossmann fold nucleotide-binding protein DprA/Smf involved in DNA uptake
MKIAVIGSRNLHVENLENYLPSDCTEIVSGGAKGIDACAAAFAKSRNIKLTEFLPQYEV